MMREGTAWVEESPEFHMQYKRGITGWLASGHSMESIHWVDQQPENLMDLIHNWLPMHLDSKINSWYLPVYGKTNLPMTMYIVPGIIALVTCPCNSEPDDYHSVLYTDQATVRQYEYIFNTIKADCLQLVEKFQLQSMPELISRFTESWHQIRNKYISMHSILPLLISLPQEHLRSICQENGIEPGRIDDLLEQWLAFRRSRDSSTRVRIVHHLGAIEHAAGEADFIDPLLSALAGQPIRVRQKHFRDYLRILCDEIQENENVELALVRSEIFSRSVWPNLMIISNDFMTAWGNKLFQNKLFSQEATLVHAFELYFSERWQQIPRICRDRQVVVSLLRDLAGDTTE